MTHLYLHSGKLFNLFLRTVFQRLKREKKCPQKSKPRNSYQITNVNTIWQRNSTCRKLFYRYTRTHTRLFVPALFALAKEWKPSICPSNENCWIWITVSLYNGLFHKLRKNEEAFSMWTCKDLQTILLTEKCRVQSNMSKTSHFVWKWEEWMQALLLMHKESWKETKESKNSGREWGRLRPSRWGTKVERRLLGV